MTRHDESKKLIDLPVLTVNRRQEISLADMASRTIILGELNLEALADLEISPYYQHTAKLQLNRNYAKDIPSDIISAKTYPGQNPLIFVLVNSNGKYHWPVYDPKTQRLRKLDIVKLLDLLACSEDTETAMVEHDFVEELSDICIQAWCEQESVNPEEVVRECALYLKPEGEGDAVKDWLNPPA